MSRHLWPIPVVGVHESSFGRFLVERRRDRPTHDRQKGGPLSTPTEPKAPAKQTLDEMVASRTAAKLPAAPVFEREVVTVTPGAAKGRKAAVELEAAVAANAQAAAEARDRKRVV